MDRKKAYLIHWIGENGIGHIETVHDDVEVLRNRLFRLRQIAKFINYRKIKSISELKDGKEGKLAEHG